MKESNASCFAVTHTHTHTQMIYLHHSQCLGDLRFFLCKCISIPLHGAIPLAKAAPVIVAKWREDYLLFHVWVHNSASPVAYSTLETLSKRRRWSLGIQLKQWSRDRQGLISPVWSCRLGSETEGNGFSCIYLWFNHLTQVQTFHFMRESAKSDSCDKGDWKKKRIIGKYKDPWMAWESLNRMTASLNNQRKSYY